MRWIILLAAIVAVVASLSFGGLDWLNESRESHLRAMAEERVQEAPSRAAKVLEAFWYVKDPRINLCFAHYQDWSHAGRYAMTVVPCEAVPEDLLTVASFD